MLVLEKMDHDLRAFIRQNKSTLTWNMVYNIFWDILSHLACLHDFDIVHKDLHSGNILQRWDGQWWLGDFGLCGPQINQQRVFMETCHIWCQRLFEVKPIRPQLIYTV